MTQHPVLTALAGAAAALYAVAGGLLIAGRWGASATLSAAGGVIALVGVGLAVGLEWFGTAWVREMPIEQRPWSEAAVTRRACLGAFVSVMAFEFVDERWPAFVRIAAVLLFLAGLCPVVWYVWRVVAALRRPGGAPR